MGTVAALLLAGVFVAAAVTKLRDLEGTRAGFVDLGLPQPQVLAWLVPALELVVVILLLVVPGWGGVAAFALLAAFTVVLWVTISSGKLVPCRCFGGTSEEPVSWVQVVRNLWLMILAAVAATISTLSIPSVGGLVGAAALVGVGPIAIALAGRSLR